jgi:uncharacterized protein (DUF2267 family)
MGFRELIKKVQLNSGFSDAESKAALENMVESLSVHLNEGERKDFASQLPQELQDIALSVYATDENSKEDIVHQFMRVQGIPENRAKKQVLSAWRALKDAISEGEVAHIKAQLSNRELAILH